MSARQIRRIVNSVAPIRVCDNGGWTDTWFAQYGRVFNIAVSPYVEVQVRVFDRSEADARVTIHAENYGETYTINHPQNAYDKHPLLEAAVDYMKIPDDASVEVSIFSEAPSGCSTGTSASVSVALIAALDRLSPGRMTPLEIASAAHRIESELLKQQSGVQDQIAAAFGGINYIEIHQYPHAAVSQIQVPDATWWELESRLSLIYVGQTHNSSTVHEMVIRTLEDAGPDASALRPLRLTAQRAKNALYAGDFEALGQSMIDNTEAQRALHPDLIGPRHQQIIDVARQHGTMGWKVNGAGGAGGSVTLLGAADARQRRAMVDAVLGASSSYRRIPIALSRTGVRTWLGSSSEQNSSNPGLNFLTLAADKEC